MMDSSVEKASSINIYNTDSCKRSGSNKNIYLATLSAQLFIMAMGMVNSYSSPACVDMLRPGSRFIHLTPDDITWIASLPNLSGIFGNALSGYFSDKFGRKAMLMYISASFTMSWLLIAYAPTITYIYAGRILSGFSAGICTVAVPTYVVEVSSVEIRGFLTAGFQVALSFGVFTMTSLGIVLRWSWLAIIGSFVVIAGSCLLFFMPESPSWLIRNSKYDEAVNGLRFLKGKDHDVSGDFDSIFQNLGRENNQKLTFRELKNPSLYKPLLIAFCLMFNFAFCGFPAVMAYSVEMLQEESNTKKSNIEAAIVIMAQIVSTIISSILMDRTGRKILYIISGSCMSLTLTILGAYTYFSQYLDASDLSHFRCVPLISFMVYISAFSLGFGSVPYVVIPELVPTHSRSFVMAVGCVSSSFLGFVVIKTFHVLRTSLGLYGLYWLYGGCTFIGFVWYWIFVPETKGRSIQEINKSFCS